MTTDQLVCYFQLAHSVRAREAGVTVTLRGGDIVFSSDRTGEHALRLSVSPPERIRAHFNGFVSRQAGVLCVRRQGASASPASAPTLCGRVRPIDRLVTTSRSCRWVVCKACREVEENN